MIEIRNKKYEMSNWNGNGNENGLLIYLNSLWFIIFFWIKRLWGNCL